MKTKFIRLWPLFLLCALTACGGSSSNRSNTLSPGINISYTANTVTEADHVTVSMVVDIQLDQAAVNDITLDITTVDGSAIVNRDYRLSSNTVVIASGASTVQFVIDILPDPFIEGDETFELAVDSRSADIDSISSPVTATIIDNDAGKAQSIIYRRHAGGTQDDLYLIQEDGSGNTVLIDTIDNESYVGTSVNGRIIFKRDTNYYSVLADGSDELQLTDTTNNKTYPRLTINGRLVYSERPFPLIQEDIYSVNDDGTVPMALATSSDDEDVQAVTDVGDVIYQFHTGGQYDIRIVSDQGGQASRAVVDTTADEFFQALTPAGEIVYTSQIGTGDSDLYIVNADGSDIKPLSDVALVNDEFVIALDNGRILFRRERALGDYDLFSVNSDGSGQVTISNQIGNDWFEGVTPDSSRIIFSHINGSQRDLYSVNVDGSNRHTIADTLDDEYFGVVIDNEQLVFSRISNGQSDLYTINIDGSAEIRLTDTTDEDEYVTFQNGVVAGRILYTRVSLLPVAQGGSGTALVSINPDGSDRVILWSGDSTIEVAGTTTSGRVIYRISDGLNSDLYSINADGSGPVVLANTSDSEFFVDIPF